MSKCILCGENRATIPDRSRMGRPIMRVCKQCHTARLTNDLALIEQHRKKQKALEGSKP